jgi:hypothetical protein
MKSFTEVSLKDPIVAAGLAAGATLEEIIIALVAQKERLIKRVLELEALQERRGPIAGLWPAQEDGK